MWPGSDVWHGPEVDIGEITPDGKSQYGALHWKGADGGDQYATVDIGGNRGAFRTYGIDWRPDYVAFLVDGVEKGRVTENVPVDFADGGEDDTIGWLSSIGYPPLAGRPRGRARWTTPTAGTARR